MITSDVVDGAPRSLADQLSDISQRFDQDNDAHLNNRSHETSSQKVFNQPSSKLIPASAAFTRNTIQRYGAGADGRADIDSVAMTAKPSQSGQYRNKDGSAFSTALINR